MAPHSDKGQRLIAALIDEYAKNDPTRTWASIPLDDNDFTKGFQDISYKKFANAINHAAHWLTSKLQDINNNHETLAYAGPKDLRYPIIAVAALKCRKQLLLCSPFVAAAAQRHLLKVTHCSVYIHAKPLGSLVQSVVETESNVEILEIPELENWFADKEADPFLYHKTWREAQSDPWLIFHTSGTTGMPKPVVYTNWMMASFDAAELMPDADKETMGDIIRAQRYYVSLPSLHFVGMTTALQWTVYLNTVLVTGPPGPVTAKQIADIIKYGKAEGAVLPPSQIEEVSNDVEGLSVLRGLNSLFFVGAPMPPHIANKLSGHCKLVPGMGSTEAGAYFLKIRDEENTWEYYCFRSSMGVEFEKRTGALYELVFKRQPQLERWQQVFKLYPNIDKFPTKDLWLQHPSRSDLWKYAGRTDDLVILSHGEDLYATGMEAIIERCPEVKTALIGGQGRPKPFVVIDLRDDSHLSDQSKEMKLAKIWPFVEIANEQCSDYVKLTKPLVTFTDPSRPFPMTVKHTVIRQPALDLYKEDIDHLYAT